MQFQSDISQTEIKIPDAEELSVIGAGYLAGGKAVPYLTEHDARNFSAELVGGDKPFFVDFERSYSLKSPVER